MARPLRLEFPGAVYHITTRGNARKEIFVDDADRLRFLGILSETIDRYNWICHAFCLMDNHYHLLIETIDPTLSKGMRQLNGMYTQYANRRHDTTGHIFQGRFKSILVEKNTHLLELCRYIVLNPVRAGLVESPDKWQWSSYNSTSSAKSSYEFLSVNWVLRQFSGKLSTARQLYSSFVLEGVSIEYNPWEKLKGQVFLGSKEFLNKMQEYIGLTLESKEIPKQQRIPTRPSLDDLFDTTMDKKERNRLIKDAHLRYGYSLKEIGDHQGIHYSTASRIVNKK